MALSNENRQMKADAGPSKKDIDADTCECKSIKEISEQKKSESKSMSIEIKPSTAADLVEIASIRLSEFDFRTDDEYKKQFVEHLKSFDANAKRIFCSVFVHGEFAGYIYAAWRKPELSSTSQDHPDNSFTKAIDGYFVGQEIHNPYLYINDLAIKDEYQGKGLGTRLLYFVIQWAERQRRTGLKFFEIWLASRDNTRRFYKQYGWEDMIRNSEQKANLYRKRIEYEKSENVT